MLKGPADGKSPRWVVGLKSVVIPRSTAQSAHYGRILSLGGRRVDGIPATWGEDDRCFLKTYRFIATGSDVNHAIATFRYDLARRWVGERLGREYVGAPVFWRGKGRTARLPFRAG